MVIYTYAIKFLDLRGFFYFVNVSWLALNAHNKKASKYFNNGQDFHFLLQRAIGCLAIADISSINKCMVISSVFKILLI